MKDVEVETVTPNGKRFPLIKLAIVIVLGMVVVTLLATNRRGPTLEVSVAQIIDSEMLIAANIENCDQDIEWVCPFSSDAPRPAPGLAVLMADDLETEVNTNGFVLVSVGGEPASSANSVLGFDLYRQFTNLELKGFKKENYFPAGWKGGEVVFATRYRDADRSVVNSIQADYGNLPIIGRVVNMIAERANRGDVIYSNPVTMPDFTEKTEGSEGMMMMQGYDG